jgi:predicted RecA/RadA family phage recombinase
MQNFIQSGKTITLIAPSGGVKSGDFVKVGGLHGFAITDAAEGNPVSVSREGVYESPKASVAVQQGDKLYFDDINKVFTTVVTGVNIAVATEDADSEDETCLLVLLPETEEAGGGGEGYEPDGTTIDLNPSNKLRVKTGGHTHTGAEITSVVPEATHAVSANSATTATNAGNADTLDGEHSTAFATALQGAKADSAVQPATLVDYVKKDGSVAFTAPVHGVMPTMQSHLATREYVDSQGGGGPGMAAVFTGRNGAGACSLPGATVGMKIMFVLNMTDESMDSAKFESTITVADEIQQIDTGDLSTKKFFTIGGD